MAPDRASDEDRRLRGAYSVCGLLLAAMIAWAWLRGFRSDDFRILLGIGGICVVLLAIQSTLRVVLRRLEALERRPPEGPAPPPSLPEGYDPGARRPPSHP